MALAVAVVALQLKEIIMVFLPRLPVAAASCDVTSAMTVSATPTLTFLVVLHTNSSSTADKQQRHELAASQPACSCLPAPGVLMVFSRMRKS